MSLFRIAVVLLLIALGGVMSRHMARTTAASGQGAAAPLVRSAAGS